MKNARMIFPIFSLLFVSICSLWGQDARHIHLGVRGVLNIANASLKPDTLAKSSHIGGSFGGYAEFGVVENLSVSVGAAYSSIGYELKGKAFPSDTVASTVTATYDYIQFPLTFTYRFRPAEWPITPYALVGTSFGINTSAKLKFSPSRAVEGQAGASEASLFDISDSVEAIDANFQMGLGFDYPVHSVVDLFLDGRFTFGLRDINRGLASETRPWSFGVGAGVRYKLK